MMLTLPRLLENRAVSDPEGTPFQVLDRDLTFHEWHLVSSAMARGIVRSGLAPGSRFALMFDGLDWFSYAVSYLAVLRAGGTAVHLNGTMPEAELNARLKECDVSWIIHSSFLTPPRDVMRSSTVAELMMDGEASSQIDGLEHDIADIRYTTGTTGSAKSYLVPHSNLSFGQTLDAMKELSRSSAMLVPMTLGTSTSATVVIAGLTSGAKMILCSPDEVEEMGRLIEAKRVDALMITPYIGAQILDAKLWERHDLASVKVIAMASSPLAPALAQRLLEGMPQAKLQIACAQSEASPALLVHTYSPDRPFSIGLPARGTEVRIVGKEGLDKPSGEVGEIWLRHPAPKRYMVGREEFNARLAEDGWYRTGDLGSMNSLGEVEFFDRAVDAITHNGKLISSIAVEAALMEHQSVREAAVVAGPGNGDDAQEIVAFVTLREAGLPDSLRDYFSTRLPEDQCPQRIIVKASLPRTQNGKLLKRILRMRIAGQSP